MRVIVGVHEQYYAAEEVTTPTETLERFPLCEITREFQRPITPQNLIPKFESRCRASLDAGLNVAYSIKFSVPEVFNGTWQPFVQQLAAYIRDNDFTDRVILAIWHEPENDVPPKSNTFDNAAHFVAYFNKIHTWIKAINPDLVTSHVALGYRYRDNGEVNDAEAKVWGSTKADLKSIDMYSGRSFPLDTTLPELSGFKRWLAQVVGSTATYGVLERGWAADTDEECVVRAKAIRREADWLRNDPEGRRCVVHIAWLTAGPEVDMGMKPDPLMIEALNYLHKTVNEPDPEPEPPQAMTCPLCNGTAEVPLGTYTIVTKAA